MGATFSSSSLFDSKYYLNTSVIKINHNKTTSGYGYQNIRRKIRSLGYKYVIKIYVKFKYTHFIHKSVQDTNYTRLESPKCLMQLREEHIKHKIIKSHQLLYSLNAAHGSKVTMQKVAYMPLFAFTVDLSQISVINLL